MWLNSLFDELPTDTSKTWYLSNILWLSKFQISWITINISWMYSCNFEALSNYKSLQLSFELLMLYWIQAGANQALDLSKRLKSHLWLLTNFSDVSRQRKRLIFCMWPNKMCVFFSRYIHKPFHSQYTFHQTLPFPTPVSFVLTTFMKALISKLSSSWPVQCKSNWELRLLL